MDTILVVVIVVIIVIVVAVVFTESSSSTLTPWESLSRRVETLIPTIFGSALPTYIYYDGKFHKYRGGVITEETISRPSAPPNTNLNINVIAPAGTSSIAMNTSEGQQSMGTEQSPGVFNYTYTPAAVGFVLNGFTPEPPLGSAYIVNVQWFD